MTVGTQTKKNVLSSTITEVEVSKYFQDGGRCYLAKSSACYKMGYYRLISMKLGTQTKTDILTLKTTLPEV
jgi:hypothetical protein